MAPTVKVTGSLVETMTSCGWLVIATWGMATNLIWPGVLSSMLTELLSDPVTTTVGLNEPDLGSGIGDQRVGHRFQRRAQYTDGNGGIGLDGQIALDLQQISAGSVLFLKETGRTAFQREAGRQGQCADAVAG